MSEWFKGYITATLIMFILSLLSGCTSTYKCPKGKVTVCAGENTDNVECRYVNE